MIGLSSIQKTVMQVAEAITSAIDIETEIVDDTLKIIGGTGRYVSKIGTYEEDGDLDGPYLYADILKSGKEFVCMDVLGHDKYSQMEGELSEISCPIKIENQIIGIIGLVAFHPTQQRKMEEKTANLLVFLRKMAELIASKLIESQSTSKLATMLESMPEGLISVDTNGKIFSCNFTCEINLKTKRDELLGLNISQIFGEDDFFKYEEGKHSETKEIVFSGKSFLFTSVHIPQVGTMFLFQDIYSIAEKAQRFTQSSSGAAFDDIIGFSMALEDSKKRALQVAPTDSTILITGESGTGKELFARSIHSASTRSEQPFVSINCGAIPEALLESELFGYEKGAFTGANTTGKLGKFELANNGTLFLDEIGDMPLHLQVKLLHVLQNKRIERVGGINSIDINVRIIAATNKDLESMIRNGLFREDLYFRLNVIPLSIPPLRERKPDLELLLNTCLKKFNALLNKNIRGFAPNAMQILKAYNWPGNVRELENVMEYSVNMANGDVIEIPNLPPRILSDDTVVQELNYGKTLKEQLDIAQKKIICQCIEMTGDSLVGKREAAKILDISESTLYRKIRELGI